MAASFGELAQNADIVYVPISPFLANAFQMIYDIGTQKRQQRMQDKQNKAAKDASLTNSLIGAGTTLATAGMMTGMGGGGGESANAAAKAGGGMPSGPWGM